MQKINSENLKTETRAIYRRYRSDIFVSVLIAAGIGALLGMVGGDSILMTILTGIFGVVLSGAIIRNLYHAHQTKQEMYARDLFTVLADNFVGLFIISAIQFFARLLGTLFFVIPGIIAEYSLSLAQFIAADETNELEGKEACVESHRLMKGNRMKLFTSELRYTLPVYIFGFITGVLAVVAFVSMVVVIADLEHVIIQNSGMVDIGGFNPDTGVSPWFALWTLLTVVFAFITIIFSVIASIGQYSTRVAFYEQLRDYEKAHGYMPMGHGIPSNKTQAELNAEELRRKDKEILKAHEEKKLQEDEVIEPVIVEDLDRTEINGKIDLGNMKVEPLSQEMLEPKTKLNDMDDLTETENTEE